MMPLESDIKPDPEVTSPDLASVVASLEPDQLIAEKEKHHVPRRELNPTEMLLFWALRIYLVFMFAVVLYQVWTTVHPK